MVIDTGSGTKNMDSLLRQGLLYPNLLQTGCVTKDYFECLILLSLFETPEIAVMSHHAMFTLC